MNILYALMLVLLFSGCSMFKSPVTPTISPSSLKENERSYIIDNDQLKLPDGTSIEITKTNATPFGNWFIVHSDIIKENNENQDDLINCYTEIKKYKETNTLLSIALVVPVIIMLILFIIYIRKK